MGADHYPAHVQARDRLTRLTRLSDSPALVNVKQVYKVHVYRFCIKPMTLQLSELLLLRGKSIAGEGQKLGGCRIGRLVSKASKYRLDSRVLHAVDALRHEYLRVWT